MKSTVIHERDQIDKPECSAGGVPLDLIRYPVTTDHDGNIVTEQLRVTLTIWSQPISLLDLSLFEIKRLLYILQMEPTI